MSLYYEEEKIDWDKKRFTEPKIWFFRFKHITWAEVGWNSEIAKTKQEAIEKAKERGNKDGGGYEIYEDTFWVPTEKEYKVILREW